MQQTLDPRHIARALAMQHLFTNLVTHQDQIDVEVLIEELEVTDYDHELYQKLIDGVPQAISEIDPLIEELAPAWPIAQISPVDLTLLRIGIWEGFIAKITPPKVVINEMIELGKEFGGENTGPFINGVLGAMLKKQEIAA